MARGAGVLLLAAAAAAGPADPLLLDAANQAHAFDGIGALSAGASSRLLWDYGETERTEILDLLFKPNYGASLQILKVEIGGDTQSTDGAEPSHEHEEGDLDCGRGYELWLLKEAKKRNPGIVTYGLSWGLPGWVGNNSYFSAGNVQYQVDWMKCMRQEAQTDVDFLGIWNERPWGSVDYTLALRGALDAAGFQRTGLVMLDGNPDAQFSHALEANAQFRAAVAAEGLHYPCRKPQPETLRLGKRLWSSEEASTPADWGGAGCWGRMLNQNYIRMNATANIAWSLIWSAYNNLDCFGNGLLYAFQPWSGKYAVNSPVWTSAHTTQFVDVGWRYLRPGSGLLPGGGTYVAYTDGRGNVTLVLETLKGSCMYHGGCLHDQPAEAPQSPAFRLARSLAARRLECWATNATHNFVRLPDVVVGDDGVFQVDLAPDSQITLTSPGNGGRQSRAGGKPVPPPVESGETEPFPLPFSEDFSSYPSPLTGRVARFFADQSGAFEASDGVLRQVVTRAPGRNQWSCNSEPFTHLGGVEWADYRASVRARAPAAGAGGHVGLCVRLTRYAGFRCGDLPAYCLWLSNAGWKLTSAGPASGAGGHMQLLASGQEVSLNGSAWRSLELEARGTLVSASVDGQKLASVRSTAAAAGQVALASGWHRAEFDDVKVEALAPPAAGGGCFRRLDFLTRDWSLRKCDPVPRDAGQGLRRNYEGYVGMRIKVLTPVSLTALGRWRVDGSKSNHSLLLLGKGISVAREVSQSAEVDDAGFAWRALEATQRLEPGEYVLLSQEKSGGDAWLDMGFSFEEEPWLQVLASVYGPSPSELAEGAARAAYGPVALRAQPADLLV